MTEKEIPAGADLTKLPTIGIYEQNPELVEAFQKAMEESPNVLVVQKKPRSDTVLSNKDERGQK